MKEQQQFTLLYFGKKCRYLNDSPLDDGEPVVWVEFENGKRAHVYRRDVLAPDDKRYHGPTV